MKKLLYIIPLLFGMALTSCYNDDIIDINNRLYDLEKDTRVATIQEQIVGIQNSLTTLENTDKELSEYITALEVEAEGVNTLLETLKAKDVELEGKIAALQEYVDSELRATEDWATATFATLEQYNSLATEIATIKVLVEQLETSMATDLTTAISTLETSMKEWVNEKIAGLEKRLDTLEERISVVEDAIEQIKALDVVFDTTESVACMVGASVEVGCSITGGDNKTSIEAWGDGGWGADIVAERVTTGKVVVTAPSEISKRGKVVVLATSGAGGVVMKSLYFEEGVLTGILNTYEVDWEACTLNVSLTTNLDYVVEIPAEAQSWLSVAEGTRATLRTETITFSVAENPEEMPARSAVVSLVGECGDVLQSFEVVQAYQPTSNPIEFADPIVKKVCVDEFDLNGDGELSYTEASKVTSIAYIFGGYDIKSFDELQYFTGITEIGMFAFVSCFSLTSIPPIPNSVSEIGDNAFMDCSSLTEVYCKPTTPPIGSHPMFYDNVPVRKIYVPTESVEAYKKAKFWSAYADSLVGYDFE